MSLDFFKGTIMQLSKFFKKGALASVALSLALTQGCAYRSDLAQGNYVEEDAINLLTYGMTGDQVRYVLGTPMLVDPFDNSRWYYVHFFRKGWGEPQIKNLVLLFNGNTLVDMSGDFEKPASFGSGSTQINSYAPPSSDDSYLVPEDN